MIHTYSLIHDDLPCMDDDDLRRGRPTNHKVYGEATAVLAGDALLTAAFETVLSDGPGGTGAGAGGRCFGPRRRRDGMVGGQTLDMAGEGGSLPRPSGGAAAPQDRRAYRRRRRDGLILAGGGAEERKAVRRYASRLGLAFQIRDDMLDVTGDAALLGKPIGSDARGEKTTFVTLKGLDGCAALVEKLTRGGCRLACPTGLDTRSNSCGPWPAELGRPGELGGWSTI